MGLTKKNFINYLSQTLGVQTVYKTSEETHQEYFAVFSVEMLGTYAPSEIELLEKMISSLQWSQQACIVCDSLNVGRLKSKYKVHFVNSLEVRNSKNLNEVFVVSPRVLNLKPEYKKQAWDELKKAISWK